MSDERSTHSATDENGAADDADSGTSLEPGGGPQRVVSDESVDDILDSLESTPDSTASSEPTTVTEATESVTTEFDEDDVPESGGGAATDVEPSADGGDETPVNETADTTADADDDTATAAADAATDGVSIDTAASSLPDDADGESLEDLADRIEDGTVTGADVRAAEAGEGRESTPEIDEVELSMDDLETTRTGGVGNDDRPDDAGPLAGSIDRDGDAGPSAEADAEDDSDDSPGLFARIKRFFVG